MFLEKPGSHLGQILQELLLLDLTGEKKEKGEKKIPGICYSIFPHLKDLVVPKALVHSFYLGEFHLQCFREKYNFLLQMIFQSDVCNRIAQSVLMLFSCVQKLVQFYFQWVSGWNNRVTYELITNESSL